MRESEKTLDLKGYEISDNKQKMQWIKHMLPFMVYNLIMLAILAFLILVYLKLTSLSNLQWRLILSPLYIISLGLMVHILNFYSKIKNTYPSLHQKLTAHLYISTICMMIYLYMMSNYMDYHMVSKCSLLLRSLPFYVILVSTFGGFLYFMPGFYDPDIQISRKIPKLIITYLLTILVTHVFLNICGI